MDDSQILLSRLLSTVPECTNNRQTLKAALMDLLPSGKREVNLLLCAYDENVIEKLNIPKDSTLHAIRMIKTLSDEYGLTQGASKWAIVTWCRILGKNEIANSLEELTTDNSNTNSEIPIVVKTHIIGIGTYKAGFDFKAGDITLKHMTKDLQSPGMIKGVNVLRGHTIDCYINSSPSLKGAKKICSFAESCHLEIDKGNYLIIKTSDTWADQDLIKIELSEFN